MDFEAFKAAYPYESQAACRAAIREQGLTNHFACGGRKNNVERYAIREMQHEPARVKAPVKTSENDGQTRKPGAISTCVEIMAANRALVNDKAAFVAACVEQGVTISTATTQWYRLRKASPPPSEFGTEHVLPRSVVRQK